MKSFIDKKNRLKVIISIILIMVVFISVFSIFTRVFSSDDFIGNLIDSNQGNVNGDGNNTDANLSPFDENGNLFLDFEELTEAYSAKFLGFAGYDSSDICDYMRSLYGDRRLKGCHVVAIEFSLCMGEGNC